MAGASKPRIYTPFRGRRVQLVAFLTDNANYQSFMRETGKSGTGLFFERRVKLVAFLTDNAYYQ